MRNASSLSSKILPHAGDRGQTSEVRSQRSEVAALRLPAFFHFPPDFVPGSGLVWQWGRGRSASKAWTDRAPFRACREGRRALLTANNSTALKLSAYQIRKRMHCTALRTWSREKIEKLSAPHAAAATRLGNRERETGDRERGTGTRASLCPQSQKRNHF
jgi:hypothetical protein